MTERRHLLKLMSVGLGSGIAGCLRLTSTENTSEANSPGETGRSTEDENSSGASDPQTEATHAEDGSNSSVLTNNWQSEDFSPIHFVTEGEFAFGGRAHDGFKKLNLKNGQVIWDTDISREINVRLVNIRLSDKSVFVSESARDDSGSARLYSFSKTDGTLQWKFQSEQKELLPSPAIFDRTIVIGGHQKTSGSFGPETPAVILGINRKTGELRWREKISGAVGSPFVGYSGRVYANTYSGNVVINPESGTIRNSSHPDSKLWDKRYLYTGDLDKYDLKNQEYIWEITDLPPAASMTLDRDMIYYYSQVSNAIVAFDTSSQDINWRYSLEHPTDSSIAQTKDNVWILDGINRLLGLDKSGNRVFTSKPSDAWKVLSSHSDSGLIISNIHDQTSTGYLVADNRS